MIKVHVFISGLVQGVFYRSWTQETAQFLGLSGWVKNSPDGQVEAIFVGDKEKVEKMLKFLYQGPPASSVEEVEIVEKEGVEVDPFEGRFEIHYG